MSNSEKECKLCGCDRGQAWPRILLRREYCFFLKSPWFSFEMDDAIRAGCRACALLKEGIEKFVNLDSGSITVILFRYREIDEAWLASINMMNGEKISLEFVDGLGDSFAVTSLVSFD
jgi:hypothetical protein